MHTQSVSFYKNFLVDVTDGEGEKKREDRQQNIFLLSSVEKNLIETHRDAVNSLPYYAVSASSKVNE